MKKKTYITTEAERFALYTGITAVYGGWILETGGTPTCLTELEDAHCEDELAQVAAIIADPHTPWEALTDEDEAYIADTLRAWGCEENPPRITPEEVAHALQDSVSIEFTDDGDIEYYAYVGITKDGRAAMRSDHGEPVSDIECFKTLVRRDDYREEILADMRRAGALPDPDDDDEDPVTIDGPLGIYEHETMTCAYFSAAVADLTQQINAYLKEEYEDA